MGNVMHTSGEMACHETIESCRSHCGDKMECVYFDKCNDLAKQYVCLPFNPVNLMWIIAIAAIIIILLCSCMVACYIMRAVRASYRLQQDGVDSRQVVFSNARRVHHVQMGGPPTSPGHYRKGPHARY